MNHKMLLPQVTGLTLVLLFLVACGTQQPTPTPAPPTATPTLVPPKAPPPVPPCFGLVRVDKLPDWAGGQAFGEKHYTGGVFWNLTSMVGCEVEGGVISINQDGRLFAAYVDDCASFHSSDIPQELRPAGGESWICIQPTGDGKIQLIQR